MSAFTPSAAPTGRTNTGIPLVDRAHNPGDFMHGTLRTDVLYGHQDLAVRALRIRFIKLGLITPEPVVVAAEALLAEAA